MSCAASPPWAPPRAPPPPAGAGASGAGTRSAEAERGPERGGTGPDRPAERRGTVTTVKPMAERVFRDRAEAGRLLAEAVAERLGPQPAAPLVLALPRGGVPVGYEVARRLGAPLDVYLVRKLGVPGQPELAMGALASGGVVVMNKEVVRRLGIPRVAIEQVPEAEGRELARRGHAYRARRAPPARDGRTAGLGD